MDKVKYKELPAIYVFRHKETDKCYVGETRNLKKRMAVYKYPKGKRPFECALREEGLDAFHLEIYYYPNAGRWYLHWLESETIKNFDSLVPNGYNICKWGLSLTDFPPIPGGTYCGETYDGEPLESCMTIYEDDVYY